MVQFLSRQLGIANTKNLHLYLKWKQRWTHAAEIKAHCDYCEFGDVRVSFRFTRWLYALCWTGTERPSVLFDRATSWMLSNKVLLPGISTLERFIARLRQRVEMRLWRMLGSGITSEQKIRLDALFSVPENGRSSLLDRLRTGQVTISAPALVRAIGRLQTVRNLGIKLPAVSIPASRIASLSRFANTAKITELARLSMPRRLATMVAFVHTLEATAQDDALEILEILLNDLFDDAEKADKKSRLRSLKDMDAATTTLAKACAIMLDSSLPDEELRAALFSAVPREILAKALDDANALMRPPEDVFYQELRSRYRRVCRFLPAVLDHIHFEGNASGKPIVEAMDFLRSHKKAVPLRDAPRAVVDKSWQSYVFQEDGRADYHAYIFCVLSRFRTALKRRDIFVSPSWRYADPCKGLLSGTEWKNTRPIICRTLDLSPNPKPTLDAFAKELDQTYRKVAARLPSNPAVRMEAMNEKENELILSPLDKIEEPSSLVNLQAAVTARLPRVDLPEILLEIAARTGFTAAFTHVSERESRATDLPVSVCAVLLAEACNVGLEPLVHNIPPLKRDRLSWVDQNYIRYETLSEANAMLVSAHNKISLTRAWGGGEIASADGIRFVVPVRTIHAGANPKYYGFGRGVTYYNLMSDQFTGLNGIPVPGTLRDSLILLALVLEQQTELHPTRIITDTGAYSDVVFGLFRLLGYRFSPRLADIGGTRFWRIDPNADYGPLNRISRHRIRMELIPPFWDDLLRLSGSLKLGLVPATGIMRTLQVGERSTRLAQALAEFGRIEKTLHVLTMIDDESQRRSTLTQLNRGEARHSLARVVFHGKRGELRQHYREGQEDQLGALGLVLNMIVLWNTIYIEATLAQLRKEGFKIKDEDIARLSPLVYEHINMLGRYSFAVPDSVAQGRLRPLRDPASELNN